MIAILTGLRDKVLFHCRNHFALFDPKQKLVALISLWKNFCCCVGFGWLVRFVFEFLNFQSPETAFKVFVLAPALIKPLLFSC